MRTGANRFDDEMKREEVSTAGCYDLVLIFNCSTREQPVTGSGPE